MEEEQNTMPAKTGALVAKLRKLRAPKEYIIATLIVAALAGGVYWVRTHGNPFVSYAAIPAQMPEALKEKVPNGVVAIVNGEKIDRSTYNKMLAAVANSIVAQGIDVSDANIKSFVQQNALNTIINNTLLRQASEKAGNKVTDDELKKRIDEVVNQLGGKDTFLATLKQYGVSESEYRKTMREQIVLDKYIENELHFNDIQIEDSAVSDYYKQMLASAPDKKSVPKFDAVKEVIKNNLIEQKKQELLGGLLDKLRASAKIEEKVSFAQKPLINVPEETSTSTETTGK